MASAIRLALVFGLVAFGIAVGTTAVARVHHDVRSINARYLLLSK